MNYAVLLVDDEERFLFASALTLKNSGIREVHTINDSRDVMSFLDKNTVDVIGLDIFMPHILGTEILPEIVSKYPHIQVIVITAANHIDTAVACIKEGAYDYIVKPVESDRFVSTIKRALEFSSLRNEVRHLHEKFIDDELEHEEIFAPIVTVSNKMHSIFKYVEASASSNQPILILGETGVGKELIARAIHDVSDVSGEFVAVNVAGLDDIAFSDTLFGHKKGAFTGAADTRDGLILKAAGGTFFLDEIGDLTEGSQVKLLRLLQERSYYPLGSDSLMHTDARLVLATNRDLQSLVSSGKFRNDLYYRLSTHQIHISALRERKEDIPYLLDHFVEKAAESMKKKKPQYPPELIPILKAYNYPGNVRELEAMVFDSIMQHKEGMLSIENFSKAVGYKGKSTRKATAEELNCYLPPLDEAFNSFPTLKEAEEYLIKKAMEIAEGKQGTASSLLGISRQALNKRLKRKGTS